MSYCERCGRWPVIYVKPNSDPENVSCICDECDNCGYWFERVSNESTCESCRDDLEGEE